MSLLTCEAAEEQRLMAVSEARAMGFDDETIADLVAQGLLVVDPDQEPWRPTNLADLNWIVSRHADYDAEAERVRVQAERRLKDIANRKKWLGRYAADCQAIVEANIPRDASGKPKRLYLDLEDGRVKLQRKGGGVVVDAERFLAFQRERFTQPGFGPNALPAVEAVRAVRKVQETGLAALAELSREGSEWTAEVLKTPLSAYLKEHPEADLPGVAVEPVRYEFTIESSK